MGFRTHADVAAVVLAFALRLVINYVFTWMFISLGLPARNARAAQATAPADPVRGRPGAGLAFPDQYAFAPVTSEAFGASLP